MRGALNKHEFSEPSAAQKLTLMDVYLENFTFARIICYNMQDANMLGSRTNVLFAHNERRHIHSRLDIKRTLLFCKTARVYFVSCVFLRIFSCIIQIFSEGKS